MIIDAHQHFWQLSRGDYSWLTPELTTLYHDFLPNDLRPLLESTGVDGTIVVQAAPTLDETHFLLSLAERHNEIKGVVGWVDFESPTAVSDLTELANHKAFVGVRPMIQDIEDIDWMLNREFDKVFEKLIELNLTFDALVLPKHLENLHQLLLRYPNLTTVIDHAAKPSIKTGDIVHWHDALSRIANDTQAYCKLSGLSTEADTHWKPEHLKPYTDVLLKEFGSERLIWGSDWPVCLLATTYQEWFDVSQQLLPVSMAESELIFGRNAVLAYRL